MRLIVLAFLIAIFSFPARSLETKENAKSNKIGSLQQVETGNLKALNQAFALLAKSDGGNAEDISIAIGKSIIEKPKNFLLALKKHRSMVVRLDTVLAALGSDFVDDFKRQKLELQKRLKALESISDESLKSVREECITELKRQIAERSSE